MQDYSEVAQIFKAFDDEKRLHILDMLKDGEKCACVLLEKMQISQPTLSHHMKILCDSGIVNARKEGKWIHYSISASGSKVAIDWLINLVVKNSTNYNISA